MSNISSIKGFPSPFAPKRVKDSNEYGLAYAKAMNKAGMGTYFTQRSRKFKECVAFARGEQPLKTYLDFMNINGKQPFIHLDYTPSPIGKKLIDTVVNKYMSIEDELRATCIDIGSLKNKEREINGARFRMNYKGALAKLANLGLDMEDKNAFTPENEDELDLWSKTKLRTREEVIMEVGLQVIVNDNDKDELKRKLLYDLCTKGIAGTKSYIDSNGRIKFRAVNMYNTIHSFSERNDMNDLAWAGEYIPMKISEVRKRWGHKIKEEDLWEMAQQARGKYGNPNTHFNYAIDRFGMREYDDCSVMVLDYSFRTSIEKNNVIKTNKIGRQFVSQSAEPVEDENRTTITEYDWVVYTGMWIVGTKYNMDYGVAKNQLKPNSKRKEAYLPYVFYMYDNVDMTNKSMIEMAVPVIRQLDLTYLKLQQIVAKARPSGVLIDISSLEDIDLGLGGEVSPLQIQEIYDQTGNIYYRSVDPEGEVRNTAPITPLVSDVMNNIAGVMKAWDFHFQRLREYIGLNEYVDSSSINPRVGMGVVESQVKASNNAIRYIYDAYENIIERTGGLSAIRFWDAIVLGESDYVDVIGEENALHVKANADFLYDMDFHVKFEAITNEEEKQILESDIQTSLVNQLIDLVDAREIRRIKNYKLANLYLEVAKDKKRKRDMADAKAKSEENAQIQASASEQANRAKAEMDKIKIQAGVETEKAKGNERITQSKLEFVQRIIETSFATGKEIPEFLQPVIARYTDELFGAIAPPTHAEQEDMANVEQAQQEGQEIWSKEGDTIVRDGQPIYAPKDNEIQYEATPSGALVTEDGGLVIPEAQAQEYASMSDEEKLQLEQEALGATIQP